ncbi:MAG: hypothetical protein I3270_00155 [Candidatus Moeniiplasma glomeromycotorum]|nr:hypothetical protein [Candidatus Moeniiplasma glomeromycotorum]MCE8166057.1 hypothetical protein [Candidatus Moeniiplasma glomeromycotorum]
MTDKIIKCDKCGTKEGVVFKGQNNTRLCGEIWWNKGCGRNVCFICGKKETRTEWRKEEDGYGNEVMRERPVEMFSQEERDENDPNNPKKKLRVQYCDEHKEEAQKSPLKWTGADDKRIEKEKEQKKLEIEEKLGSQKGLFYCYEPFPRSVEWKREQLKGIVEYGCVYFWGQENGQNFFLMVPDTHPVLKDLKYKEKVFDGREFEHTLYNLKKQFYLIEGVDNLPLETTDNRYEGNDPYAKAYRFSKFVGLSDKIKLIPVDSQGQPEKNKPVKNEPNHENISVFLNSLKEYFQKNDIKLIKLVGDKWVVEYNHNQKNNEYPVSSAPAPEFQALKKYFQQTNKNVISLAELNGDTNSTNPNQNSLDNKILVGCIFGGIGLLIIGVVIGFILKKKKVKKT